MDALNQAGSRGDLEPGEPEEVPYLLDLYKFAVEMADRISARRATANSFFLTVNAAFATFIGLADSTERGSSRGSGILADRSAGIVLCLIGMILSGTWWVLLRSFRDLSRAKWSVITGLEDRMEIRLFQDEWKLLKAVEPVPRRRRYRELGVVERVVPVLFFAGYVGLGARVVW